MPFYRIISLEHHYSDRFILYPAELARLHWI